MNSKIFSFHAGKKKRDTSKVYQHILNLAKLTTWNLALHKPPWITMQTCIDLQSEQIKVNGDLMIISPCLSKLSISDLIFN